MICCNSAFEQGNLVLWRYINAFIIIQDTQIQNKKTKSSAVSVITTQRTRNKEQRFLWVDMRRTGISVLVVVVEVGGRHLTAARGRLRLLRCVPEERVLQVKCVEWFCWRSWHRHLDVYVVTLPTDAELQNEQKRSCKGRNLTYIEYLQFISKKSIVS